MLSWRHSTPTGCRDRLAVFVAAATSAEQVLLWPSDDPDGVQLGTPAVLAPSDLNAARERAKRVLEQGKALREELPRDADCHPAFGARAIRRVGGEVQTSKRRRAKASSRPCRRLPLVVAGVLEEAAQRRDLVQELGRTQALLSFSGQAMSELAVEPTLNVAVEQIADLLGVERVAVYLNGEGGLRTAAARGLQGAHELIAARMLDLALASGRLSGGVIVADALSDGGWSRCATCS